MKATDGGNLKHRQLHIEDYLQMVSAEQKEYAKVCSSPKMAKTNIINKNGQTWSILEEILIVDNLNRAYKQVKRNKGAGGIDGMELDELLPSLIGNREYLKDALRDGKYRPSPVRRV